MDDNDREMLRAIILLLCDLDQKLDDVCYRLDVIDSSLDYVIAEGNI